MLFDLARFDAASFQGVPDEAVRQFALPPHGFVRSWVEYMLPITDAPLVYHLGTALGVVSTLIPASVILPDGDELPPNLFTMLVGPSTKSRKTHAIAEGRKALERVAAHKLMNDDGSGEGFADAILANSQRLIVSEEGGMFLQHTMTGTYASSLRSRLTAAADCSPVERHTSKRAGKGAVGTLDAKREPNPRVGFLMGCTPTHLEEHTFKLDWEGGFLSRFLILHSRRQREMPKALLDVEGRVRMDRYLAAFAKVASVGACAGMNTEAETYYQAWQRRHSAGANSSNVPSEVEGVLERAQRHVRKVSLILAYDRHVSRCGQDPSRMDSLIEQPWSVDLDDVRVGCALGDFHAASVLHLRRNVSEHAEGQFMRKIRNFVADSETKTRTFREIVKKMDRNYKTVAQALDTLCISGGLVRVGADSYTLGDGTTS